MASTDFESLLNTVPENDKNTVKAFLLMQQERIEALETIVYELQNGISSRMWYVEGLSLDDLRLLADKILKLNVNSNNCSYYVFIEKFNIKCTFYDRFTFKFHIEFKDFKNKLFIKDLISVNKPLNIYRSDDSPNGYYTKPNWQYLSKILEK